jgi:hypothetical protein
VIGPPIQIPGYDKSAPALSMVTICIIIGGMTSPPQRPKRPRAELPGPPRPDGLVERLAAPAPWRAATYERADAAPAAGDRRRRRRAKQGPWRGRFIDLLG